VTIRKTKPLLDYLEQNRQIASMAQLAVSGVEAQQNRILESQAKHGLEISKYEQKGHVTDNERKRITDLLDAEDAQLKTITEGLRLLKSTILCLDVENWLNYLSDLLSLVFITSPKTLISSEQKIDIKEIFRYDDRDDLIRALAERHVERLSYLGFADMASELEKKLSFKLLDLKDDVQRVTRLIELRNLIVHNRGIVNQRFLSKVRDNSFALGQNVAISPEIVDDLRCMKKIASSIDSKATVKFKLPTMVDG